MVDVAVLGGGLTGCGVAVMLARRGARVVLFERRDALLLEASSANEGKIHLGYVYAADRSGATARTMLRGALSFHPIMRELLGERDWFTRSSPFIYPIHRDSQLCVEDIRQHFTNIHTQLDGVARGAYFDADLHDPVELRADTDFEAGLVQAAFQTAELAIDPWALAGKVRTAVAERPNLDVRCGAETADIRDIVGGFEIVTADGARDGPFDHVVNATWSNRLLLDAKRNLAPPRPCMHRVKFGFRFRANDMALSTTFVLGSFGDTVAYENGARYVSWYPAGMCAKSLNLAPPPGDLPADEVASVRASTFQGMGELVPAMRLPPSIVEAAEPVGGVITAYAETDINDRNSGLHERYDIGVHSHGRYHSIDTGKFTMAPYFAHQCADRILPS